MKLKTEARLSGRGWQSEHELHLLLACVTVACLAHHALRGQIIASVIVVTLSRPAVCREKAKGLEQRKKEAMV